jgi:hypothetical protein
LFLAENFFFIFKTVQDDNDNNNNNNNNGEVNNTGKKKKKPKRKKRKDKGLLMFDGVFLKAQRSIISKIANDDKNDDADEAETS